MNRKIKVTIAPGGKSVQIATKGFEGAACEDATRKLEEALGAQTANERTAEYFERPPEQAVKA